MLNVPTTYSIDLLFFQRGKSWASWWPMASSCIMDYIPGQCFLTFLLLIVISIECIMTEELIWFFWAKPWDHASAIHPKVIPQQLILCAYQDSTSGTKRSSSSTKWCHLNLFFHVVQDHRYFLLAQLIPDQIKVVFTVVLVRCLLF